MPTSYVRPNLGEQMPKYWISVRQVQGDDFTATPDLGSTRYLRVPDGEIPKPQHQIAASQWVKEILASFPASKDGPTGDILFFIHGYNNSICDVDRRHMLIQAGLTTNNFKCLVVSFDWPSGTDPLAYLPDRDKARLTAIRIVNAGVKLFVKAQQGQKCDINVHVLGHSTGAFAIREAFDHADDGQTAATNWTAGQLVFIAGDVSAKSFSTNDPETESTYRHCYRLTNYCNGYDEVLQVSNVKRVGLSPRVGRVGLPADAPEKAANVDCSDYYHRTYPSAGLTQSHSWYFEDATFHKDLAITLIGAIDRYRIPTRKTTPKVGQELV
jgi:esterase/lipase superfamily enzyme